MSQTLLATIGFAGCMVAIAVDGRHAVVVASVAAAAALAPAVAVAGGEPAALVLMATAAAAGPLGAAAGWTARRGGWVAGLDPLVPVVAPPVQLFGPRSLRVIAAALALPASSWTAFNLATGETGLLAGVLFTFAYCWLCGAARLLLAATVEDLAAGTSMVALAGSAAWMLHGGSAVLPDAALMAAVAPLSAATAGWLAGRHQRRESHLAGMAEGSRD